MATKKVAKCKICGKKYVSKSALIDHIDKMHSSSIPEGWNAARYENYLRTGKTEGRCVYCKKVTTWNDVTGKYNRMCGSEECKKTARELANKNYIGLHGKPYSINNPEQQKKMVYGRKNSGKYIFKDEDTGKEYIAMYDSSYGKDFFEMIDLFLNWDGADIIAPSPHTYWYEYEGKKHFYIPDAYSTSLNLEIEFKDGGDNPNKHPKILAVDKVKEQKKDEVMKSLKNQVNYIKICNKDYSEFFALLSSLKEKDVCQLPKWESKLESIYESTNIEDSYLLESKSDKSISPDVNMSKEFNKLIKRYNKLNNPILNYDDLLGYYRKRIFYDNLKKHEWQYTYNELLNVRNYLKKIVNSSSNGLNDRMYYEASKTLKEINNFILYMEDRDNFKYVKESLLESATKSKKYPVYIVSWDYKSMVGMGIKMVTRSKYNHTSISLSPDLEKCYTFSRNPETLKSEQTNGFCNETMSYMLNRLGDCNIKVDAVYVSKKKYDKLKNIIDYYIEHQEDTSFSYKNFVKIFFGIKDEDIDEDKLNCSVFTDLVLKKADVNLTGDKPSNLVTPKDLSNVTNNHKDVITVYTGKASLYDKNKVKKIMMESMGENNHTYDEGTIPEVSWFSEYGKDVNLSDHTGIPIDESLLESKSSKDITKVLPSDIIKFNIELNNYDYAILVNDKVVNGEDMDFTKYRTIPVSKFKKYHAGVCWDFVNYEAKWFKQHNYQFETYYIQIDDGHNCPSHTFLLFKYNGKTYYFESSWFKYQGIEEFNNTNEALREIVKRHVTMYGDPKYPVVCFKYNTIGLDNNLSAIEFMDEIFDNGKFVEVKGYTITKKQFDSEVSESTFIEGEKDDTKYYPIFIILSFTNTKAARIIKKFTHDPYSHASISFDTTLNNMVSFDANGMVDEDISKGVWKTNGSEVKYSLYMYMATEKEYESMRNFVNNLLSRRYDLKYNFLGLTNFIFGRGSEREDKFFCSEFVTAVINAGNNNLITDKPYMVSPYMLAKNKNFKFVKRGIIKNYSPKVVDNIVRDILEEGGYTNVQIR